MPQATAQNATVILTSVVRSLVSEPERVGVDAKEREKLVLLTLSVSPTDLPVVLGPGGRTSRSLQAIAAALGKRSGVAVTLEIQPERT